MTIVVANVNFDSNANNQLYVNAAANTFILKSNSLNYSVNTSVIKSGNLSINTTGVYLGSRLKSDYQVGDYLVLHANAAQPANTLLTNTSYLRSSYTSFLAAWPDDAYPDSEWTAPGSGGGGQICYGNSLYVSVGSLSQSTSTDLITWTDRSNTTINPNSCGINDVTYGSGTTYVAVGGSGVTAPYNDCFIISSTDGGVTWVRRTPATNINVMFAVSYGAGVYVAVGGDNTASGTNNAAIQTSTNGTTWANRTPANVYPYYPTSVIFGLGTFIANDGTGYQTSNNGTTWTYRTSASLSSVVFGNNKFVATTFNANGLITVLTSANGLTWSASEIPYYLGSSFNTITYGGGLYVISGAASNSYYLLSYDNAVTWYLNKAPISSLSSSLVNLTSPPPKIVLNSLYSSNIFTYNATTNFKIRPMANSSFEKTYVVYQ